MQACFYGERNDKFEETIKVWNKTAGKHIGKVGGNTVEDFKSELYLNEVAEHLFKIPFNSEFNFTEGMHNRLRREFNNIDNNYKSKKLGVFKRYFYVSDAIANYSPVTRMFYHDLNMAINFERNNLDQFLGHSKEVAGHIRKALITMGDYSNREAKKYMKDFAELEGKIIKGGTNEDNNLIMEKYTALFEKSGGEVVKEYINLMQMDNKTFKKEAGKHDRNLRLAVETSRELLDKMGKVLINGLGRMGKVVELTLDNPLVSQSSKNYTKRINEAKKRIQEGIEDGGYLPHYLLANMVEWNYKMRAFVENKDSKNVESVANDLISQIETMIPHQAKSRNDLINQTWAKNPFFILNQYAKDVIAFNKIAFIQEKYIPAMRKFQKEDVNPEFVRSMRNYLEDSFQVATKGLMERPNWVNSMTRSLMAVETIKSMGLSVTGAIRNGASALYFFAESGFGAAREALKTYNLRHIDKLAQIEKEQGFKFGEAGRELIAEGLIPSSVNVTDIVFDPLTEKVSYRDRGALKTLDPLIDKTVGASLVFHRFTENATRKWMFRIAWVQAYETLRGHNIYKPGEGRLPSEPANERLIQKKATEFALKSVNKFAFEYAAHAKARGIGGTAPRGKLGKDGLPTMEGRDYATALGELTFQFMHYPMSFLNLQSKILKGSYDAALSGQWDAPELKQALRFAGIYGSVGFLSLLTNLDLTNTLENDTVERVKHIVDYLTLPEKELEGKYRGLINDFTGPVVGDVMYAMNMFQLTSMPDERWQKMLLGYIDYYDEGHVPDWADPEKKIDTTEKRHMWNRLSTEFGRWMTKSGPALRDGRGFDILRHELGWYPSKELKEGRKKINEYSKKFTGFEPLNIKSKGSGEKNLIKLINEMR